MAKPASKTASKTASKSASKPAYRRVIVKVSGEALSGPEGFGIHQPTIDRIAQDLIAARRLGVTLGVVVGGGNILRGVKMSGKSLSRPTADAMGMLATVMNSLALETALNAAGVSARTMSAVSMPTICETYARQPALHYLDRGQVVDRGTHGELVRRGGLYAELYEQQFRGGLVEAECEDGVVLSTGVVVPAGTGAAAPTRTDHA